jgi:phosphomannomutase
VEPSEKYYRYCPGEEHVKISDAVCRGRRRVHFPKCKGCQFNDDEPRRAEAPGKPASAAAEVHRAKEKAAMLEKVFKAYDVRGTTPDPLDEDMAWRIGAGAAQFLRAQLRGPDRADAKAVTIVVGRDMRKSSPALSKALIAGIHATGVNVVDVGMIDTSQIYFAVNYLQACGGIQTTASHNPAQYNGFKVCGQRGKPVGADTGLNEIRKIAQGLSRTDETGEGRYEQRDLSSEY